MTNQQNIIQLIKQWHELEPDTCSLEGGLHIIYLDNKEKPYSIIASEGKLLYDRDDEIQLAIQKQIIKRNWTFKLQCFSHSYYWAFKISNGLYSTDATGDDLIETMLGCYVKMLGIVK